MWSRWDTFPASQPGTSGSWSSIHRGSSWLHLKIKKNLFWYNNINNSGDNINPLWMPNCGSKSESESKKKVDFNPNTSKAPRNAGILRDKTIAIY